MKVYSNDKLIKRNGKLGNIFSIGSLVILGIGFWFSFKDQGTVLYLTLTYACLILGFLLFQVGNYYVNRWGRSPRPDEHLTQSLKGLDDKYSLYHFTTGVAHLLVGPAGVIALLPYNQNGTISYDASKNAWRQRGGNFFMKVFGQEGLGRPVSDAKYAKEDLDKYLGKLGATGFDDKTSALLVFTNEKADIQGEGSTVPYTTTQKLKDYLRRKAKENPINPDIIVNLITSKE